MFKSAFQGLRSTGQKLRQATLRLGVLSLLSISLVACGGGGGSEEPQDTLPKPKPSVVGVKYAKDSYMPAGFQAINDAGVLQIDQDYLSYGLSAKGSFYVRNGRATVYAQNSVAPVLCIRPTGGAVAVVGFNYNPGGQSSWTISTGVDVFATSATVEWWVFDAERASADTGPGLSVYDATGKLAYNSNTPEMQVTQVVTTPATGAYIPGDIWTSIGSNKAVCMGTLKTYFLDAGQENLPYFTVIEAAFISGSSLVVTNTATGRGPIFPGGSGSVIPINTAPSSFLIVDTAHL